MDSPNTVDHQTGARVLAETTSPAPVVIEAHGLKKAFRIPEHRVDSLKERAAHPFTKMEYRELHALRDISFDVHRRKLSASSGATAAARARC